MIFWLWVAIAALVLWNVLLHIGWLYLDRKVDGNKEAIRELCLIIDEHEERLNSSPS